MRQLPITHNPSEQQLQRLLLPSALPNAVGSMHRALCCVCITIDSAMHVYRAGPHSAGLVEQAVEHFTRMLFLERLRTPQDRQHLFSLYVQCWGCPISPSSAPELSISPEYVKLGWAKLPRTQAQTNNSLGESTYAFSVVLNGCLSPSQALLVPVATVACLTERLLRMHHTALSLLRMHKVSNEA